MTHTNEQEQAVVPKRELAPINHTDPNDSMSLYLDRGTFEQAYRAASMFAKSDLVPSHFKGKPENVMILFNMARRLNADPVLLMQKTHIIQGRPGMEAQLVIALVNSRGPFGGPINWVLSGEGDDRACTAYAHLRATGEKCEATVTWKMAKLEGWTQKNGSKWMTIPDQMFKYRSAVFLARLYCPEVIFGIETVDEIADYTPASGTPDASDTEQDKYAVSGLEERLRKPVEASVFDSQKQRKARSEDNTKKDVPCQEPKNLSPAQDSEQLF